MVNRPVKGSCWAVRRRIGMDDIRTPCTSISIDTVFEVMTEFYQWHGVTNSVHTGRFSIIGIQPFLAVEDAIAAALRLRGSVFVFPEGSDVGELVS